jgi:hypothetical protein
MLPERTNKLITLCLCIPAKGEGSNASSFNNDLPPPYPASVIGLIKISVL